MKKRLHLSVSLLVALIFATLLIINPLIIDEHLETLLVDYRFKLRNLLSPPSEPDDILIVAIDEKSLSEYGRWPWNRKLQAELIRTICEDDPRAVAVDIFYPEPETPESDWELASVFSRYRVQLVVALGFEVEEDRYFTGEVEDLLYDHAVLQVENYRLVHAFEAFRVLLPPEPIASAATLAHVYAMPDSDGKLRREHLYIKYGDEYFPSLALTTARIASNIPRSSLRILGGTGVDLDELSIPADEFGRLYINYLGPEGTIPHISASDLLSGRIPAGEFRDKIVLIGTSAIATYDTKVTPFSANMPGVEKNATVIHNILTGNAIKKAPLLIDLFALIMGGVFVLLVAREKRAGRILYISLFLTALYIILNQICFTALEYQINLTYPLLTLITGSLGIISYNYFFEERRAQEIKNIFSSYVTEKIVNELVNNPEMARLGGQRREVTVLFSDIRGFTAFSEKSSPENVVTALNEYLGAMTEIVFRWEGTLDKFVGDGLVAFWGAPLPQDNHAGLAISCAIDMQQKLSELQQKWSSGGRETLSAGIGINTGEVVVGNIGAEGKKMDYTVIGDNVNLGSRIESLTRELDAHILISEFTYSALSGAVRVFEDEGVRFKQKGAARLKGKEKLVGVYEVIF